MKKRFFVTIAAAVCSAMLLSGCSAIVNTFGEAFFGEEDHRSHTTSADKPWNDRGKGIKLYDTFVPFDTEKLAISSRDSSTVSVLAGDFIPEDCLTVCPKYDYSNERIDLNKIAKNFPNLKELYIFQAKAVNREAVAEMESLEALTYYVLDESVTEGFPKGIGDSPFKGLKNLKTLRLYGEYTDYSFLNEMPQLEDIHVELNKTNSGLKSLLKCGGITSLELDGWATGLSFDITGIEKLTKLKKLNITALYSLDFTPIGKLKSLEDLHVRCTSSPKNVSALAKATKLRKVFLSDLDTKDWSFLKQMKSLTELSLYYIPNIKNSDLASLKQLRKLTLSDTGCDVAAVKNLPNLEEYSEIMGDGGDFSVFMNCPRLRVLNLLGCKTGVMDFSYVQSCPLEEIKCDGTKVENVRLLANIKTLKSIYIATNEQNIDCGDMLKKALPGCEVSVNNPAFFNNHP